MKMLELQDKVNLGKFKKYFPPGGLQSNIL